MRRQHANLNEDLIQPEKLEMGISHRTGGRTWHFDWGRHEITPGWSANRKLSRNGVLGLGGKHRAVRSPIGNTQGIGVTSRRTGSLS